MTVGSIDHLNSLFKVYPLMLSIIKLESWAHRFKAFKDKILSVCECYIQDLSQLHFYGNGDGLEDLKVAEQILSFCFYFIYVNTVNFKSHISLLISFESGPWICSTNLRSSALLWFSLLLFWMCNQQEEPKSSEQWHAGLPRNFDRYVLKDQVGEFLDWVTLISS